MLMTAKFSGVCAHCGGRMPQGSKIDYNRAERRARHPECVTAPEPRHFNPAALARSCAPVARIPGA